MISPEDHECGHRFEITVRSAMHVSGPGPHEDWEDWGEPGEILKPVVVRANGLAEALRKAAELPLTVWFDEGLTQS